MKDHIMPTGTTDKILKEDNVSLEEFALRCSRAWSSVYSQMGNDDLDAPIPEYFKPKENSFYHEMLDKAQRRLVYVKKMSYKRAQKCAEAEYNGQKDLYNRLIAESASNGFKLGTMLAKVAAYTPPTEEFEKFKEYMIDQLEVTVDQDADPSYYIKVLGNLKQLSAKEWKEKEIKEAKEDIEDASMQIVKAGIKNLEANCFIATLRATMHGL